MLVRNLEHKLKRFYWFSAQRSRPSGLLGVQCKFKNRNSQRRTCSIENHRFKRASDWRASYHSKTIQISDSWHSKKLEQWGLFDLRPKRCLHRNYLNRQIITSIKTLTLSITTEPKAGPSGPAFFVHWPVRLTFCAYLAWQSAWALGYGNEGIKLH